MKKNAFIISIIFCVLLCFTAIVFSLTNEGKIFFDGTPMQERELNNAREKNSGFKEFSFEIKESYESDEEIDAELEKLGEEFKTNIEGCSDKYVEEQTKKYNEYVNTLKSMKSKISSNIADKEKFTALYDSYIKGISDDYQWASSGKLGNNENTERIIALYNYAMEIDAKYKANEISAKQAYEELIKFNN